MVSISFTLKQTLEEAAKRAKARGDEKQVAALDAHRKRVEEESRRR